MKRLIMAVAIVSMALSITSTVLATTPDIKANNSDSPITLGTSDTLSITVSLSAEENAGANCDWWVAESAPDGWYYYSLTTSWTSAGSSYTGLSPTYQGELFDLGSYSVLNTSGLSEGTYTFYFVIDTNMNGSLDMDQLYYDSVEVTIETGGANTYNLSVTKDGTGTGSVLSTDGSINCGNDCTEDYTEGTVATLTATPDTGSTFTGWSGGGCSGTGDCVVTMNEATTVTATFNTSTSSSYKLPDTGQTESYTDTWGEDSDYLINPLSYTDNGDGTVTDNNTGFMWQQVGDDVIYSWYEASGTADDEYNPGGATNVCGSLTLADHSDWRLPNVEELSNIVDYGTFDPAIDDTYFWNTYFYYYWSSTTLAENTTYAWCVSFGNGDSSYGGKRDSYYDVRCVRSGQ